MNLSKILSYVVLAVGAVGIVLWWLMNGAFSDLLAKHDVTDPREVPLGEGIEVVSPLYGLTLGIIAIVIVVTLIAVFSGIAKNPASLKKTLIGLALFAAVLIVSYVLSSGTEEVLKDGSILTAGESKLVGAGLTSFYILGAGAVLAMLVSGVQKLISN